MSDYWGLHIFLCNKRQEIQHEIEQWERAIKFRRQLLKSFDRVIGIFKSYNRSLPVVLEEKENNGGEKDEAV